jgi:hypothetical protein
VSSKVPRQSRDPSAGDEGADRQGSASRPAATMEAPKPTLASGQGDELDDGWNPGDIAVPMRKAERLAVATGRRRS